MKRLTAFASLVALLAACENDPFNNSELDPVEEPVVEPVDEEEEEVPLTGDGIPVSLANNLQAVTYDAATEELTVQFSSLDAPVVDAIYERDAGRDVPGYIAFTQQDDPLDRFMVAYVAQSEDESAQAVLVMDGGQFNRFFGGVNYSQEGAYSAPAAAPDSGLVSYAGYYVGLLNYGPDGPDTGGIDPALVPREPTEVTGQVFINADFADNTVNGAIYDRVNGYDEALDAAVLIYTDVESDGSFNGQVQNPAQDGIGTYGGIFGGADASSLAGGVHLEDFIDDIDAEQEFGIFVLNKCGTAGDAAICDNVNP